MSKNVVLMEFEGNPNIGIYMFSNNKFCLIGREVDDKKKQEIEKVLEVPVYKVSILETELVGIFVAGNDGFLVVPELFDYEKELLEKICKEHDTKLVILNNRLNTFGNNMSFGEDIIMINSEYTDSFIDKLKKLTKLKVVKILSEEYKAIGSVCKFANSKFFVSQEFDEKEMQPVIDKVAGVGTINAGSAYIASGAVCNNNGLIIGSMSTTVEIQNIVESLDFL